MKVQSQKLASAQERINEVATRKKEMTVVSKIDGIVVKVNKNVAKTETGVKTQLYILFPITRIKSLVR